MNNTSLNITLPSGNDPSPDSLLYGGGGDNFPKFYPGGSLAHDLLPSELLERFTLFSDLFRKAAAFFEEQVQIAASLQPLLFPVKEELSKGHPSIRIEDYLLPSVFPEQTYMVYPAGEAAATESSVPPLEVITLSFIVQKIGEEKELSEKQIRIVCGGFEKFVAYLENMIKEGNNELFFFSDLIRGIASGRSHPFEPGHADHLQVIRDFCREVRELQTEYFSEMKNLDPFRLEDLRKLYKKIEEKDLLITAELLQTVIPNIPVDNAENLLTWLGNPENQEALGGIQNLYLSGKGLKTVPTKILQYCSGLQGLDLGSNQINSVPPEAFQGLGSLQTLYLYNNRITSIPSEAFRGLGSLQGLNLDNNQISSILPEAFQGLGSLQYLWLQSNQINSSQPGSFQGLPEPLRQEMEKKYSIKP